MLPITATMWDWKRPSYNESVTAQWSHLFLGVERVTCAEDVPGLNQYTNTTV